MYLQNNPDPPKQGLVVSTHGLTWAFGKDHKILKDDSRLFLADSLEI